MMRVRWETAATTVALAWAATGTAQGAEPYCESNPAVIYCNDFESGGLDGIEAGEAATIVDDASGAPIYDGTYVLQADFTPPYNAQAEFGVRFAGVERVYMRMYLRFDATWEEPMHHFYAIHGDHPDDMWSCHGDAGCRPNGELCLSGTTVDFREAVDGELPGEPFFYTYHPDMSCDPGDSCANYADPQAICDGCADKGLPCENGLECCWGNWFDINQGSAVSMVQDTWYAVETMVAANTPGMADGEMALWIDGELVAEHGGIAWRNTPELLFNHAIIWNYFPALSANHRVWFDNLVISTDPIGAAGLPPGGDTGDDGGADDTGGGGGPNPPGDDGGDDAADAPGGTAGSGASSTTDAAADGGNGGGGDGCGCTTQRPAPAWTLALPLLALWRTRRRPAA